jgi:hypothetical protein
MNSLDMSYPYQTKSFVLALIFSLSLIGCARLPQTIAISSSEAFQVTTSFKEMVARQKECGCCIDCQARVSFDSIWEKGTVAGYVQSLSPSFLKFVAVNPFGQPLFILATDGISFQYVSVPEAQGYEGSVAGETFSRYAPEGFSPESSFYWLIGRLSPGILSISDISKSKEGNDYWFDFYYENGPRNLVLFDAEQQVVLRHLLIDENDEPVFDVSYGDYQKGECPLPGTITIGSLIHNSTLELKLYDCFPDVSFPRQYFDYHIPAGFKRTDVQ